MFSCEDLDRLGKTPPFAFQESCTQTPGPQGSQTATQAARPCFWELSANELWYQGMVLQTQ